MNAYMLNMKNVTFLPKERRKKKVMFILSCHKYSKMKNADK